MDEELGEKECVVKEMWRWLRRGMLTRQRVIEGLCFCGRKVADLKICLFSATKQDRVGPSLQSRNSLFTSAVCCTDCTVKLDL